VKNCSSSLTSTQIKVLMKEAKLVMQLTIKIVFTSKETSNMGSERK
jgi:hypothetical protein